MNNITVKFLQLSSLTIFVFAIMVGFNWYESGDSTKQNVTTVINLIGNFGFSGWLYAVSNRSNIVLAPKGILSGVHSTVKLSLVIGLATYTLLLLLPYIGINIDSLQNEINEGDAYTARRIYYSLIFITGITAVIVLWGVPKLLCSAERGKEVPIGEYYKTVLLLLISWIGVWFIHPRAQKL